MSSLPLSVASSVSIHPSALVESDRLGAGTRIWAFAHVMEGAVVGRDCNIGDHCFLEGQVLLGDRVTVKNGVAIWRGVTLEDDVFVGPNVVFTNDPYPRSRCYPPQSRWLPTLVRRGATIGANATVLCGVEIGRYALIGAGAVVSRTAPDFALLTGVPARRVGWVCRCAERLVAHRGTTLLCPRCAARYVRRGGAIRPLEETIAASPRRKPALVSAKAARQAPAPSAGAAEGRR